MTATGWTTEDDLAQAVIRKSWSKHCFRFLISAKFQNSLKYNILRSCSSHKQDHKRRCASVHTTMFESSTRENKFQQENYNIYLRKGITHKRQLDRKELERGR